MNSIKYCFVLLAIALLPVTTLADLQSRMLAVELTRQKGVNKRLLDFKKDLEKAKSLKEFIPSIKKYASKKEDQKWLSDLFHKNGDIETPTVEYMDKVVVFNWKKTGKKITFEVDTKKGTVSFKNKTVLFKGESVESLALKLNNMRIFSSHTNNIFINEAHAVFGAALLFTGLISLVVDVAVSRLTKSGCADRFKTTQRSFQAIYASCITDTISVFENPAAKEHTYTHNFLQDVQSRLDAMGDHHWKCENSIQEEFYYWNFFSTSSCVSSTDSEQICKTMDSIDKCLSYFGKLKPSRVNQQRGIKPYEVLDYIEQFGGNHNGSGTAR
ncbi:MAG: hypothetical protein KC493_06170 [Bacteriovoracaceae bacterium]|nr:hypothetical protein [Bacteriovoracaceae bacterium]